MIEANAEAFKNNCKSLEIDEDKAIICYDNGELVDACKAYWGFKATGYDNVKVLLGGVKACEKNRINLVTGEITSIVKGETPFLPFNEGVALNLKEFADKEAICEQVIEAKKINFEVSDANGGILSQSALVKLLNESDIEYKPNKMTIVHGKNAYLIGMILHYLGERTISVVLDDTSGFVSSKKNRKTVEYQKLETLPRVEDQTSRKCACCLVF